MTYQILSILIIILTTIVEIWAILNEPLLKHELVRIAIGIVIALDVLVLLGILLNL